MSDAQTQSQSHLSFFLLRFDLARVSMYHLHSSACSMELPPFPLLLILAIYRKRRGVQGEPPHDDVTTFLQFSFYATWDVPFPTGASAILWDGLFLLRYGCHFLCFHFRRSNSTRLDSTRSLHPPHPLPGPSFASTPLPRLLISPYILVSFLAIYLVVWFCLCCLSSSLDFARYLPCP